MDVTVTDEHLGSEDEADVSSWLVASGTAVTLGQPIAELETSKVQVQVEAPAAGILTIVVEAGAVIEPGAVIAQIA